MDILRFMVFILSTEILLSIFYYVITPKTIRKNKIIDYKSILKGIVERIFLFVSLINNYPHALTLFGALKLATRLKRDDEQDKVKQSLYNDFYLVGNFISVMIAIFYVFLYEKYIR